MILITGAGGKTGRTLIRTLADVEGVCAFIHHAEQEQTLRSLGAERVVIGDLRDEHGVRSAMRGVRAVYHICPNMAADETAIGNLIIRAAREDQVEHLVYHSVLHPQTEKMNHHWQKLRLEEKILESGLRFTIFQPAPYMQNLLAGWKSVLEDGVLRVPYSIDSRFSFVDLEDVAEAARIVLTEPGHEYATYELAGTIPISHRELATVLSRVLNRNIRAEKQEITDWRARAEQGGMNPYAIEKLTKMFEYYDRWGLAGNPNLLGWILKRQPTTVELFVERILSDR
jgi:uncharacterized protein YbjT (DUF2867 family)